ncbi:MAG: glycosyltransferase family 2 protein [Clostridia bacterium]|nr:glycosyltransferase family 2 protein [Clostridia bacterium]
MAVLNGPRLSACVVLYQPDEEVLETVRSLAESTCPVDIYIVNNNPGSTEIPAMIKAGWPQAEIITCSRNLGYGEGNNQVINRIHGDYHLICNPDISFAPDLLQRMIRWMDDHPDVGVLSPRVLNPDGTEQFLPRRAPTVRYLLGGSLSKHGDRLLEKADRLAEEGMHHRLCEAWWRSQGLLPEEPRPVEEEEPVQPFDKETHVPGTAIERMQSHARQEPLDESGRAQPVYERMVRSSREAEADPSPEETLEAALAERRERGLVGLLSRRPTLTFLRSERIRRCAYRLKRLRSHYTMEDAPPTGPVEVDFATGCFLLIRTKLFYRLGGFDRHFFLYHEDSDLTLRARGQAKVVYNPEFCVTHAWHRASSHSLKPRLHHIVSSIRFFNKWGWTW